MEFIWNILIKMDFNASQRSRRNVSMCFLYQGKDHKFLIAEPNKECERREAIKKESKRNFFNSPTPQNKLDNDSKA